MPIIQPFRGIRYNQEVIADFSTVTTPPYDVISPEQQEAFYEQHPQNFIRLELIKEHPVQPSLKYLQAAKTFAAWREQRVLCQEEKPAFYFYEQTYIFQEKTYVRSGFFAAVRLSAYEQGEIFPHEETLPGPKVDRLHLAKACEASFSPIFTLYSDREKLFQHYLNEKKKGTPFLHFKDEEGVEHRLWIETDTATIGALSGMIETRPLYIADGHHRYETALTYEKDAMEKDPALPVHHPAHYVFALLVNMEEPGLTIWPTHRVLSGLSEQQLSGLNEALPTYFHTTPLPITRGAIPPLPENAFILQWKKEPTSLQLILKDPSYMKTLLPSHWPLPLQQLDVVILHKLILEKLLGIPHAQILAKTGIDFIKQVEEVALHMKNSHAQLAFLLQPIPLATFKAACDQQIKLPQKSTYFYPKVRSGMLIYPLS